ncbi:hypothetical protein [Paenibacillus nanensis]|nr:hypothetical protein [Paenibacillus nanensis]
MMNGLRAFLAACALVTVISGCSRNEPKPLEIMFYGESENWTFQYHTDSKRSGNNTVSVDFYYKGKITELLETKRIVFSYGTSIGSIAETLHFDQIDTAYFNVEFDEDLIQGIVGKPEEKMRVILEWEDKRETMNITQYEK